MDEVYRGGVIGPGLNKARDDYASIVALGKVLFITPVIHVPKGTPVEFKLDF